MTLNIPFMKVYVVLRLLEPNNLQGRNKFQMSVNISDCISPDTKTQTRPADKRLIFVSLISVNYKHQTQYLPCQFTDLNPVHLQLSHFENLNVRNHDQKITAPRSQDAITVQLRGVLFFFWYIQQTQSATKNIEDVMQLSAQC